VAGVFFQTGLNGLRSDQDAIRERDGPFDDYGGLDTQVPFAGTFTNNLPVSLNTFNRSGSVARSFFDDYYNRVYFLPNDVDFGAISTSVSVDVYVWNAHRKITELTTIQITNGEGLSIDGPAVPYDFLPLGLQTYTITATPDGDPTLDADITFTFDTPEVFVLDVLGTRARVSPLVPNWERPFEVTYNFKTEVITSRSGKEQRRAHRIWPRKTLSYTASPTGAQLRDFNALMDKWLNNVIVIPEVPMQAVVAATSDPGEVIVTLTENAPSWIVDDATVIFSYRGVYETRTIDAVSGTQITLTGASALSWPAGTKVHPARAGRFAVNIRSQRLTNTAAEVAFEMQVTPGSEPVIAPPSAPQSFNGRELFLLKPNWSELPEITFESDRDTVDFEKGRIETFVPVAFNRRLMRFTYTGRDFAQVDLLREHFFRMRGQQGEFYAPTWERDVVPKGVNPATSNSIRINGTDFAGLFEDSTVHKAVMIEYVDGTFQYTVVQDIYTVDDSDGLDSVIQTEDALDQDVSSANISRISWLLVWRYAADALTVEWMTNAVGRCQVTFRTLEDLA
jgi:hypothetical protein